MNEHEPVSVLVCTRDRPASLRETVRGILASDYDDYNLFVVDQSSSDSARRALDEWHDDPRLHYVATRTAGLANARNLGVSLAPSGIVVMTDDDCRVPVDWVSRMVAAFDAGDDIAVVFGNVVPAPHDDARGFILGYLRNNSFIAKGISDKSKVEGMGACMAIRSSAWSAVSGFDPMLGAGSRFPSADETDFVIRALLAGFRIHETPEAHVVHDGFRPRADADRLIHGYLKGIGAMLGKHAKCGIAPVMSVYRALASRWMFAQPVVQYGFFPSRWVRLSGFAQGWMEAMRLPVNKSTRLFKHTT